MIPRLRLVVQSGRAEPVAQRSGSAYSLEPDAGADEDASPELRRVCRPQKADSHSKPFDTQDGL